MNERGGARTLLIRSFFSNHERPRSLPYRPRFTIYTPTPTQRLRFPMTWTPLALHEVRDGKRVSGQATTKLLGWLAGRARVKRLHIGAYGTWCTVRSLYHC